MLPFLAAAAAVAAWEGFAVGVSVYQAIKSGD
ncbi:Uncharacterised protein [Veillonella parvula]|nr:Uncharacterised protein [Veillonella parvula]